ncbi:MAG: molybdopterin molybdotransferase MoeA [Propionicimonas sp.]
MPDAPAASPSLTRAKLTAEQYRDELLALVPPGDGVEQVRLDEAFGRVLAADVAASVPNPAFTNSAMDGYAVRATAVAELPARLRVVADIPAGSSADPELGAGECARVMTGAPLPTSADTVVPVEDTDAGGDWVEIRAASPGRHVRRAGEDYPAGQVVAAAGLRITPGVLGAIAAAGATQVAVRPAPVVAVCATGDELVADGAPLVRGQLYESNSHVLAAALRRDGARVLRGGPVPDRPAALAGWLDEAAATADLIVLTGGASVGTYDVVRDLLTERAAGVFRHVRVQPGKPQGWARWAGTPVIALPGNPLSASLCYEFFVRPVVERLLGTDGPPELVAVAGADWGCPPGRMQLLPVRLSSAEDGLLLATPVHARGSASHLTSALGGADAIGVVPAEVDQVKAGDLLRVRLFG